MLLVIKSDNVVLSAVALWKTTLLTMVLTTLIVSENDAKLSCAMLSTSVTGTVFVKSLTLSIIEFLVNVSSTSTVSSNKAPFPCPGSNTSDVVIVSEIALWNLFSADNAELTETVLVITLTKTPAPLDIVPDTELLSLNVLLAPFILVIVSVGVTVSVNERSFGASLVNVPDTVVVFVKLLNITFSLVNVALITVVLVKVLLAPNNLTKLSLSVTVFVKLRDLGASLVSVPLIVVVSEMVRNLLSNLTNVPAPTGMVSVNGLANPNRLIIESLNVIVLVKALG